MPEPQIPNPDAPFQAFSAACADGDTVLVSTDGIVGLIIQMATDSEWNHAVTVTRNRDIDAPEYGELGVVTADWPRIRWVPLRQFYDEWVCYDQYAYAAVLRPDCTPKERELIGDDAWASCGLRYDGCSLLYLGGVALWRLRIVRRALKIVMPRTPGARTCSENVGRCHLRVPNHPRRIDRNPESIPPEWFWRSAYWRVVHHTRLDAALAEAVRRGSEK